MKIKIFSLLFLLITCHFISAQEEITTLKTPTGDLEGTLLLPEGKTNMPVVLIIAGSGPTDRNGNNSGMDNNSLKMIAELLNNNGFASLRYDKRGIGKSSEAMVFEKELRFETYIDDVKSWIELLAKDKRFSKIIVAGHSEGSLLGMVAAENNTHVNAYISIAGVGRPADEVLKEQLSGAAPEAKTYMYNALDMLKKGDTLANVPPIYYSLFRPSVQPYMISWMKYNPQSELKKLHIPVLILQGNTDIQVTVEDANLLSKALPAAELKIINNMNHVLKTCDIMDKTKQLPIYSDPLMPLNKEFSDELVAFIKKLK